MSQRVRSAREVWEHEHEEVSLNLPVTLNVFVGTVFSEALPVSYLRRLGGAVFIVLGVAMAFEWL